MGKTRKELEREVRQNFIVDATEELFAVNDFDRTTMDEIAAKAQFSKATLYNYVKSKDELALLVYQKINRIKVAWAKEKIESQKNGYDKLYAFCKTYFNFYKEYPQYLKFQIYLDHKGLLKSNFSFAHKEFNDYFAEEVKYMEDVYLQGIEDGSLRDNIDVHTTLDLLYLTLRSVMNQVLLIDKKISIASLDDTSESNYYRFVEIFLNSLKSDKK